MCLLESVEELLTFHAKKSSIFTNCKRYNKEGLALASIAQDDPSTFPSDDPFPRARMHRDRNVR